MVRQIVQKFFFVCLVYSPVFAVAALPDAIPEVRYMSLGDSLAAGYKAQPATKGFVYQLYLKKTFGERPETAFSNSAVPGAKSSDVANFQIPQVALFQPNIVTISVGGNDLLVLLSQPDPIASAPVVLGEYAANLGVILTKLCIQMPERGEIYLNNLYVIPGIPGVDQVVPLFNAVLTDVVANVKMMDVCADKTIAIADVYSAFIGEKGLLLIERYRRRGIDFVEVHPTNKGHRAIERAYLEVIAR